MCVCLSIYLSIHRAALDSGCFFVGEGESPPKLINLFGLLNPEMRTSSTLPLSLTRLTLNYHLTTNNNNNRPRSSQDIGRHLESQAHRPPGTLRSPTHVEWTQDHGTTSRPAGALTTETLSWLLCVCICVCVCAYMSQCGPLIFISYSRCVAAELLDTAHVSVALIAIVRLIDGYCVCLFVCVTGVIDLSWREA